ncbi:DUF3253 domain-containing protein [Methylobacterium sp. sgz302541]|uniref:DUF3253 domain-containing protein n=1 Tax=unclassified Methylobacterium TaxID=2615210 RepID=UPI003D33D186
MNEAEIEETMLRLVAERGKAKTVCPSEVARALGGPAPEDWGRLMKPVRRVAVRLVREGRVAILRKGRPVADPEDFRGVYRLGVPGSSGAGNSESE